MGAYTALHVGIRYPQRCLSVVAAGCGWGSSPDPEQRAALKALAADTGRMFAEEGIAIAAAKYADAPMRQAILDILTATKPDFASFAASVKAL